MTVVKPNRREYCMLETMAELEEIKPEYLLEDLCRLTKEKFSFREYEEGKLMPYKTSKLLETRYNERMAEEKKILKMCKETSKELWPLAMKAIVVIMGILWLLYLISK